MSTISGPRDSSVNGRRIPSFTTPTSSSRPSLDIQAPRSAETSPNRGATPTNPQHTRRNRAALREYYNLKKTAEDSANNIKIDDAASEVSVSVVSNNDYSDVQESEMDAEGFDAEKYVKELLETQGLAQLMKTYHGVLTDIRALDAEKKALVYDNYSKLIAATETIRKMRTNMDPLNPMASTLDPAIASIYERANGIKMQFRDSMTESQRARAQMSAEEKAKAAKKDRLRDITKRVLETPERLRQLVAIGKLEQAKSEWEPVSKLLEKWKMQGVGGSDVQDCIDDGEAALKGEPPNDKSWVNLKENRN
ncbi:Vps51/Vps67-domain-containing protein, partial [Xylogone sp. PMI_703]